VSWFDSHNSESASLSDSMRSLWSKLEAACARIALVLHLLDWAEGDSEHVPDECLLSKSVQSAVRIVEYFKAEAILIYSGWDASLGVRELKVTLRRVQQLGGSCTEREYARSHHLTLYEATAALQKLIANELAQWEDKPPSPKGGRATRRIILLSAL
jgi:Protein of unknown function (DUF3987)